MTLSLLAALAAAASGCRARRAAERTPAPAATADTFTRAVQAYLDRRGDLCVGRPTWPIDVPEGARLGPDVVQLPVLERLGVVTSTVLPERRAGVATPFNLRRYRLTAEGRKRYIDRETRLPVAPEDPPAGARADFCVLSLALGKVTRWEVQPGATPTATVSYTYTVDAPAWVRDPGFQRVFPAVARLVAGAGTAELVEGFTLAPAGWTANELLPGTTVPGEATAAR
ncbi:MAG TPA: hypothetical protein VHL80_11405 [Polyangia bacterium]|nr:hypothetical protein [Polyangia bacterium]